MRNHFCVFSLILIQRKLRLASDSKFLFNKICLTHRNSRNSMSSLILKINWLVKARDSRNGGLLCDFKDNSGTFNAIHITIPGQGKINSLRNQAQNERTTEVADMIKLVVNHWRVTSERILPVSKIREFMALSSEIKASIPRCPWVRSNNNLLFYSTLYL